MKVLVVDTSVAMVERLKEILSEVRNSLTIYGATSYEEAINVFNETHPEVILLDMSLTCNKSFALLKEIRKTGIPASVIVLSLNTDDHIKQQCKLFSVDFLLDKYYEFEKIPAIISKLYMKKQA